MFTLKTTQAAILCRVAWRELVLLCSRHYGLQPALLYLSPAGLLFSLVPCFVRGALSTLFAYKDDKEEVAKEEDDKEK